MSKADKLRHERAGLIKKARAILDLETEERELTTEETGQYESIMKDVDAMADKIKVEERQAQLETQLDTPISEGHLEQETKEDVPEEKREATATEEYRKAFWESIRRGDIRMMANMPEVRALQMDQDTAGGYAVMPQEFVNSVILKKKDLVFVRQRGTVHSIPKAASMGAPAFDTEPEDTTWTGEISTRDEDTAFAASKRELFPHPSAKLLKVSKKLLRASGINIEALVRDRLAYKYAITEETAFLTGSGAMQPLGVFTASANGISTGRDVSTGNTTTTIEPDNLFNQQYNLKQQYRANAAWVFHRDAVKMIAKFKDGEGRYLLTPDPRANGFTDRLLGYPMYESEYAPSTFTTGLYVGILGDFSYYWIADALSWTLQHLVELYAATNQDGFIGIAETDGMPVLEEAFTRVKLA